MYGACRNVIEVKVPQDERPAHLGREKAEQLMLRVKEGHKVRVRICQPCNACYGCTLVNVGLSGVIGGGEGAVVEDRGRSRTVGQNGESSGGEERGVAVREGEGDEDSAGAESNCRG